jgi:8-oxo-dGTP pyrophosphatase MutT (NUDIX family)
MSGQVDPGTRIGQISDELRALAENGLFFSEDDHDRERFTRMLDLAAELLAVVDTRSIVDIQRTFRGNLAYRTPAVGVDAAIFDESGRLLVVQRTDTGDWCLPGGAVDVGESPSSAVAREVREETGLVVRAKRLIGVFDNRTWRVPSRLAHIYHLVFECDRESGELTPSIETRDFRWVDESSAAMLSLFAGHIYKVPHALRMHRTPDAPAAFH